MTHEYDRNTDPNVPPRDAPPRGGTAKRVPPLVWIVLGLLVLMAVFAISQYDGSRQTPSGGVIDQADTQDPVEAVMPATDTAPAQ